MKEFKKAIPIFLIILVVLFNLYGAFTATTANNTEIIGVAKPILKVDPPKSNDFIQPIITPATLLTVAAFVVVMHTPVITTTLDGGLLHTEKDITLYIEKKGKKINPIDIMLNDLDS